MDNKTTNVNVAPNYPDINAKVVKVMIPQQDDNRITIVLNKEFTTIDMQTGEEKITTMFSINIYNLVNQIGNMVPEIQLADTLAMGNMVNPQIISLAIVNADIVVKREFHAKGEKREQTNDVYANNCIVSKVTKVKTNIAPIFNQMLMQLISTQPAVIKAAAMPNPFGI